MPLHRTLLSVLYIHVLGLVIQRTAHCNKPSAPTTSTQPGNAVFSLDLRSEFIHYLCFTDINAVKYKVFELEGIIIGSRLCYMTSQCSEEPIV